MEEAEQARAYAEADFEEPHNNFVAQFQQIFGPQVNGYVLDLGCGPGDVSVRFARAFSNCVIHGVDGSEAMLQYGKKTLNGLQDVQHRIKLIKAILPGAALPLAEYDAVISNSLLHHLENPMVLWDAVKLFAKQGAPVFIMDLQRPRTLPEARSLVETYASNAPEVLRRDFFNSLCAAFEADEIRQQLQEAGLEYLEIRGVSDRHVVIAGKMPKGSGNQALKEAVTDLTV